MIFNLGVSAYIYIYYMCVCVRAACKDNQNIIMVKYITSRSMILILLSCIFLGSNDDRGWKKLACGMGTNFSPGILLTCFLVVGQQSCLSIVLQKSRLNKAIFSCAFQHKKSMLFSTEKAHTHRSQTNYCHCKRLQSSTQTCPHEVQEERMPLKLRRTSSSLATK